MSPLRCGDFVTLTIGSWSIDARVALASDNGRAIVLRFDGAAPVGGGLSLGMLPVHEGDDGAWRSVVGWELVIVEPRPPFFE